MGRRARTDKEQVKARGLRLPSVATERRGREEERGRGTQRDRLRRHVCVRASCHSGQWPWQQAVRSAEGREEIEGLSRQQLCWGGEGSLSLKRQEPLHNVMTCVTL